MNGIKPSPKFGGSFIGAVTLLYFEYIEEIINNMPQQLFFFILAASTTVATTASVKQPNFRFAPENGNINSLYSVGLIMRKPLGD